jgi:hypothetical protein
MANFKGKDGTVRAGGQVVGEVKSWDITETANEVDASKMGSDWTNVQSTQNSWNGSLAMFWDPADTGQIALSIGSLVTLDLYPRGNTATFQRYTGQALITSVGRPQAFNGLVEMNVEFTGNGTLTKTVV